MTARESLQGINAYPIPSRTLTTIMTKRGVSPSTEVTSQILNSSEFRLAHADVLFWLSEAPNIAQGGQNYSFSDEQRKKFRDEAIGIYEEEDEGSLPKTKYGYKGDRV